MKKKILFFVICLMLLVVPVSVGKNKVVLNDVYAAKTTKAKTGTTKGKDDSTTASKKSTTKKSTTKKSTTKKSTAKETKQNNTTQKETTNKGTTGPIQQVVGKENKETPKVGGDLQPNDNDLGNGNANCAGIAGFVYYGVYVIKVLQIIVPIALILWGTIDLLKSIISGDEKKISAARKPFIQRLISAVIVFLLPWIANFFIGFASSKANSEWQQCWKDAWNGGNKSNIKSDDLGLWD